jgi:hypothetical protein
MTLGVLIALENASGAGGAAAVHRLCGWTAAAIAWLQVAVALLRGDKGGPTESALSGDHYDMTPRRVAFERVHKSLGWIAVPSLSLRLALDSSSSTPRAGCPRRLRSGGSR